MKPILNRNSYISFLPWYILIVITFGLASFWVIPYILATKAAFYENLTLDLL
ncbi:MAG: DUF975 family protein [Streptococcaceae bacterium]|nr:DUF975 family protein [Streptococcaceae bacterium]